MTSPKVEEQTDRAPPIAEVEAVVLGSVLHNPDVAPLVLDALDVEDLTREPHRQALAAMRALAGRGDPVGRDTVLSELVSTRTVQDPGNLLHDLEAAVRDVAPSEASVRHHLRVIVRDIRRRRLDNQFGELREHLRNGVDPDRIVVDLRDQLDALPALEGAAQPSETIDEFLASDEPEHDWLVPGLLERGDRVILTGPEGGGKSTLLRQIAVQVASGIHPFATSEQIEPIRVTFMDLENSGRHLRRRLRPLHLAARQRRDPDPDRFRIEVRPQGLDLLRTDDAAWLTDRIVANRPDLLIIGPLYKMATGDPTDEEPARHVALLLDQLRALHEFALITEAHSPHGNSGNRPTRPYGASIWLRWPEFGIHLGKDGSLTHWRGARDERDWPTILNRGGAWPWTVPTDRDDARWSQILKACETRLTRPSRRELVDVTGISRGTVQRLIDDRRDEWARLFNDEETP